VSIEQDSAGPLEPPRSVFFSYHFGSDQPLVSDITKQIERQGLELITGDRLGGGEVPATVKNRIRSADAVVALLTRRYRIGDAELKLWDTYPWVRDELAYGYQLEKRAIAIVESGVEVAGAFTGYERITFERERWAAALGELEKTLLLWTGQLGVKPVRVQMLGEEFLAAVSTGRAGLQCRYRWWSMSDDPEEWTSVNIRLITGGVYFLARRPPDENAVIEVEVLSDGTSEWESPPTPMHVTVTLHRSAGP
jgi:TIR domain-containing protein